MTVVNLPIPFPPAPDNTALCCTFFQLEQLVPFTMGLHMLVAQNAEKLI